MIKFKFVVFLCVLVILIFDIINDIINDIIDDIINDRINSYCSDHSEHLYRCLFYHDTKTGLEQGEPCPYCK